MRHHPIFTRRRLIAASGACSIGLASGSPGGAQEASPVSSPVASPVAWEDLPLEEIAILTGSDPASINQTGEEYGVDGTDLGSTFLYNDLLYIVFGDTFDIFKSDWRSNAIAISSDDVPSDGIVFDRMIEDRPGHAKELLSSKKIDFEEMTVIPTYGVAVGDRLFLHYMSVAHWGPPGQWDLGLAGWAYSDDAGENWTKDPDATWPGDTNWGQVAIEEHDGHLYLFGIPGGRYGDVKLARVVPESLLQIAQYEYWDGSNWVADAETAAVVIEGPAGELSVRWNSYYQRWLMMTLIDDQGLIVVRTALELTGPWDESRVAVRSGDYPALYAPYMFPKWNDGPHIYFIMSLFGPYNCWLMKTSLPDLAP
jgi:hypothetical protein